MNHKWLRCFLFLCVGVVVPARAQLQFVNVSTNVGLGYNLYGVTCGGASNAVAGGSNYVFVAVGASSSVAAWAISNSVGGLDQSTNWVSNSVAGASYLAAATFGGNQFLVSGTNNTVFSSADGMSWANSGKVFNNSATAQGLAFNNGTFVAVASAPEINWSASGAPGSWTGATITNLAFADSFRGVTAFNLAGANSSFAACGVLGRLVASSDGGRDWGIYHGQIGQPDLNGIASDGGKTLVCVGGGSVGTILTFTNGAGGPVLSSSTNSGNTLSAVTYIGTNYLGTNYGFMAVGKGGTVLTSSDGVNWTTNDANVTQNPGKKNLNAVFFSTSGLFKGVGVMVGDGGTIILAGTPPPVPVDVTPAQTNCAGEPNANLVVTLNTVDYPVGTLVADWSGSTNFSSLETNVATIDGTNYFEPPAVTANITVTNVYYVRARDLRTGFVSPYTSVTNIVYEQPTITSSFTTPTICNGESDTVELDLTGHAPWTVEWSDGAVSIYTTSPAFRSLTALELTNVFLNTATNYAILVTNLADSYCVAQANNLFNPPFNPLASNTVPVTVDPRPTSTSVTTNEICNGEATTLTNILTGLGPWVVTWTDGTATYSQTVNASQAGPYTNTLNLPDSAFMVTNVNPNQAVTNYYWVTQVVSENLDGHACTNWATDLAGTNVVIIDPRPTSTSVTTNEICNGETTTLTNVLNGLGSWVVTWTDGAATYTQAVNVTQPGPYINTLSLPNSSFTLTNSNPNRAITNYYWVTQLVDVSPDGHLCTNWPVDLTGTNEVIIDPRPTSASMTTNEICNGETTKLTNVLSGLGPWVVTWTDGTSTFNQTVNVSQPGMYINTLTLPNSAFASTNTNPNQAVTNFYWVTQVVSDNLDGHACTNWPGDLTGTNEVVIDPRPTSRAVTTNEICNGDVSTVTNVLTGLGPWVVTWTDGTVTYTQNVNASQPGAYTNTLNLPNGVFDLTNANPNMAVTNRYWVMQVVSSNLDGHACTNWPSDLAGTNAVVINPIPTASLSISIPDFLATTNFNGLGTDLVISATNSSSGGSGFAVRTKFTYKKSKKETVTLTDVVLSVTNHLSFTGVGPWNVVLSNGSNSIPLTFGSSPTNYVWQQLVYSSTPGTNFTFSIVSVANSTSGCSGFTSNTYNVVVNGTPTADVYGDATVCGGSTNSVTIYAILGGVAPWTNVIWSDGFTNNLVTNSLLSRDIITPTNNGYAQYLTNYSIVSLTDASGTNTTSTNDLTDSATITVDPVLDVPPTNNGQVSGCYDMAIPLVVSVPNGFAVDWYDVSNNLVASGTNVYVPPAPVDLGTNSSVTNVFMALSRFVDPNFTNCYSPAAVISVISLPCITSITPSATNITIQWTGDFKLQSATNLEPPVVWSDVTNGAPGTNYWTNLIAQPPTNEFFRLVSTN